MNSNKDIFLKRTFEYKIQYVITRLCSLLMLGVWVNSLFFLNHRNLMDGDNAACGFAFLYPFQFANTYWIASKMDSNFCCKAPIFRFK